SRIASRLGMASSVERFDPWKCLAHEQLQALPADRRIKPGNQRDQGDRLMPGKLHTLVGRHNLYDSRFARGLHRVDPRERRRGDGVIAGPLRIALDQMQHMPPDLIPSGIGIMRDMNADRRTNDWARLAAQLAAFFV